MPRSKIQSEIQEIALDTFSYKGTNTKVSPTFVNFFYGSNGSGKSTFAKALKTGNGIKRQGNDDCQVLTFDQEFINSNIQSYGNLPGVFTLDHGNIDAKEKIEELTAKKTELKSDQDTLNTTLEGIRTQLRDLKEEIENTCWETVAEIKKAFSTPLTGSGKRTSLYEHIIEHRRQAADSDIKELQKLHASAFSNDETKYGLFKEIPNADIIDGIATSQILGKPIVNSSETDFAGFLKRISASEWFRSSHSLFHDTEGKCPYCQQMLPSDFENVVQESFDQQYESDIRELESVKSLYENEVTKINLLLSAIPSPLMPGIDLEKFNSLVNQFKLSSMKNLEMISHKTRNPSEKVELSILSPVMKELREIINSMNDAISEHNNTIDKRKTKQKEWEQKVWKLMAFRCKDDIEKYEKDVKTLTSRGKDIRDTQLPDLRRKLEEVEKSISEERKKTVETVSAMAAINRLIKNANIQGIKLVEHGSMENTYRLVRSDGSTAKDLSEGEKNFIAFLYFYHLVTGSDNSEGRGADSKIVVIDDPVSSMDSSNLYLISSLIRNLVNVCINAADESLIPHVEGTYITQLFILTHNVYFHKAVTQGYEKFYEPVSFFLIRKENEQSRIKICKKRDPAQPTDDMNDNPVKNDYSLLWSELKNSEEYPMMMSCMRRILDYYFIQLCGMDGISLKDRLFNEDNIGNFITTDPETGMERRDKLDIASALVSQMEYSTSIVNDGMYYVDDCSDTKECLEGFRLIFKCMGQEPHYNMMMQSC